VIVGLPMPVHQAARIRKAAEDAVNEVTSGA
jgi:hypothetical protein